MKCIRIKFVLPKDCNLSIDNEERILLRLPEGSFTFKIKVDNDNEIYNSYTLKSEPLSVDISHTTIEKIENALHLSFIKYDIGLLINVNLVSGYITETGNKEFGGNKKSDFIGVQFVDDSVEYVLFDVKAKTRIQSQDFFNDLEINISNSHIIDDKLKRAIELFNSTIYISRLNNSGRFILLMSAIECLITQKENPAKIVTIIKKTQEDIKNIKDDTVKEIISSIIGSLEHLKKESISKSGQSLVESLFMDSMEKFKGMSPANFFKKAYNLRSQLVHDGKTSIKDLDVEDITMLDFTHSCLMKYYERMKNAE